MTGQASRPVRALHPSTAQDTRSSGERRARTLGATVLMVHRDATVRRLSRRVLEGAGCRVAECGDARSALRRLASGGAAILIIDLSLDSALAVVRRARRVDSAVRVVFVATAFTRIVACAPTLASGETFLEEPLSGGRLVEAVRLVASWPTASRSEGGE